MSQRVSVVGGNGRFTVPGGLARITLHAAAMGMALVWMLPSVGLLVSSFRTSQDVARSGWWTSFDTPWTYTLENYRLVLSEHVPVGDPEQKAVANLAGGTGYGNAHRGLGHLRTPR